ncbi:hypothetical protein JDV09_13145 [Mycobacterium sp. Y57]|uniref:hypothetical protein n=1 Tax=Mycolicibacterium xanthum TaxID=2796469 RepID=UPI001C852F94|nr:hypothetical protein [Mycolicibacterium xanthum]MBX7433046.1 hypothetical protein [Mycolicibacterium xanthum]
MTTNTAANVVCLESHPAWRAAQRRACELEAAMRRHPSFQSRLESDAPHLHSV